MKLTAIKKPTADQVAATSTGAAAYIATHSIEEYWRMYAKGWAIRTSEDRLDAQELFGDWAFQDGYSDRLAGREMFHLSKCHDPKCRH